jgi:hypothetical protein
MAETKDSIFWTFAGTVGTVTVLAIMFALAVAAAEDRDSMGFPCSISTAQKADGSLECQ